MSSRAGSKEERIHMHVSGPLRGTNVKRPPAPTPAAHAHHPHATATHHQPRTGSAGPGHALPPPHQPTSFHDRPDSDTIVVARPNTLANGGHQPGHHHHHREREHLHLQRDTERPAKRRKLSIRTASNTLHHYFPTTTPQPSNPPSTRVAVQAPHGQLVQTINGVTSALDAGEDDLLHPSPRPQRVTRSPQPGPPLNAHGKEGQKQEDKRSLRSHDDGPRLKSDLAIYFPNYEDVIFDAPKEEEFLTPDATLYITDDAVRSIKPEASSPVRTGKASHSRQASTNGTAAAPITPHRPSSSDQFNGSPSLNLDFVAKAIPDDTEDPLTDAHFSKSHKRAERKEKQLRNIEKERAMHEKVQLERLLDGLQGHDWLRVLGITGVTDGEAKKYEQKRDYFIAEVKALVDKFRQWREQEKKQRLDREAALAAKEAEEEEANTSEGSVEPPSSDLNASAAKQLQQETFNTIKAASSKSSARGKERMLGHLSASHTSQPASPATPKPMLPPARPSPEVPIASFYSKRHLRDAALSRSRSGRNVTAFGRPLPEMDEYEFELPAEYVTEDALRANARERRRRKRESAANST